MPGFAGGKRAEGVGDGRSARVVFEDESRVLYSRDGGVDFELVARGWGWSRGGGGEEERGEEGVEVVGFIVLKRG